MSRWIARSAAAAALASAFVFGSALAVAGDAYAPPSTDAQAVQLYKAGKDVKSNFEHPTAKVKWGRASIFVNAPMKDVKAAIIDYGNWSTFITKFQKSKVLKKDGTGSEVYLQLPIMKGAATIWAVEKFGAPVAEGKGEKIVGTMVKGNVDDLQAIWHYRPVDENHTVITLEIYTSPKVSAPATLILKEMEDACGEGVLGVRARAEASVAVAKKN
ncbi:MAG: hypothetical protein IPJ34_20460 [Myxococcales bacterium]|nr:hypothetical protein [Myxococcales bacterium]